MSREEQGEGAEAAPSPPVGSPQYLLNARVNWFALKMLAESLTRHPEWPVDFPLPLETPKVVFLAIPADRAEEWVPKMRAGLEVVP